MQHPLKLRIDPKGWHLFSLRRADPAFRKFQDKILKRDNNICQFCTFQGTKYFEVINIDGNYNNNKTSNMASACCLCTQCLFIDNAGTGEYGGGVLIYSPKISQEKLNSLCHVLFCVMANNTGYRISAKTVYRNFKFGAKAIEKKFGKDASTPVTFGKLLIEADIELEEIQKNILDNMRLLPSRKKFSEQIRFWADEALDALDKESEIAEDESESESESESELELESESEPGTEIEEEAEQ